MKIIPCLFRTRLTEEWPARLTGNDHGAVPRTFMRWFKLQVSSGSLSNSAHGRMIDDAAWSNPYSYHFPSLTVHAAGDLLVGFSGSRATEYIEALWVGRKAGGQTTRPVLIQPGRAYVVRAPHVVPPDDQQWPPISSARWGDYSFTCVDPDGTMFWTVQEYAEVDPERPVQPNIPEANAWGTWITSVRP